MLWALCKPFSINIKALFFSEWRQKNLKKKTYLDLIKQQNSSQSLTLAEKNQPETIYFTTPTIFLCVYTKPTITSTILHLHRDRKVTTWECITTTHNSTKGYHKLTKMPATIGLWIPPPTLLHPAVAGVCKHWNKLENKKPRRLNDECHPF